MMAPKLDVWTPRDSTVLCNATPDNVPATRRARAHMADRLRVLRTEGAGKAQQARSWMIWIGYPGLHAEDKKGDQS